MRACWPRHTAKGLVIAVIVAIAASFLSEHYHAPVMLFALLIGMSLHFLHDEQAARIGIEFASKHLLRIGVALLGLRLSFSDITHLGLAPVAALIGLVLATIGVGLLAARVLRVGTEAGLITGGAVAICGASAALAISAVLPSSPSRERNTLFAVVAVTSLSTIAMILYPVMFGFLHLSDHLQGVLFGATIHDVAQVVGAGYAVSDDAGETATIVKLFRVALLPLIVIVLATSCRSTEKGKALQSVPWFAFAFAALVAINSTGVIPAPLRDGGIEASRWLLVIAISALGIKTSLGDVMKLGGRHICLVVAETMFLLAAALGLALLKTL
jgi:uncharacterized integral membrane protein (TIGR00698 family)